MRWKEIVAGLVVAAVLIGIPVAALAYQKEFSTQVLPVELSQWKVTPEVITVKAGTKTRLLLMATDVTHGFQIGRLINIKAIYPGHPQEVIIEAVDPGTYEISCSANCGTDHSKMAGKIVVVK